MSGISKNQFFAGTWVRADDGHGGHRTAGDRTTGGGPVEKCFTVAAGVQKVLEVCPCVFGAAGVSVMFISIYVNLILENDLYELHEKFQPNRIRTSRVINNFVHTYHMFMNMFLNIKSLQRFP